jgi:hypothetical protein
MQEGQSQAVVIHEPENSTPKGPIVLDSLPYVDAVHEDYEQYALSLIEDEMKTLAAPKAQCLPSMKLHSKLLQNDYETLSKNPDNPEELQLSIRAKEPAENTVEEWRKAVKDARAEYEAERQRSAVLEIEKSEASTQQWKQFGTLLETLQKNAEQQVKEEENAVDVINAERQKHQEKVGHKLHLLASQWHSTTQKYFQLQLATRDLESQVESMRSQTAVSSENGA